MITHSDYSVSWDSPFGAACEPAGRLPNGENEQRSASPSLRNPTRGTLDNRNKPNPPVAALLLPLPGLFPAPVRQQGRAWAN